METEMPRGVMYHIKDDRYLDPFHWTAFADNETQYGHYFTSATMHCYVKTFSDCRLVGSECS